MALWKVATCSRFFWDPYLKFYYRIKKERLTCLDVVHHTCLIFTWGIHKRVSTEYTSLLLDERLVSFFWLCAFTNVSQKQIFLNVPDFFVVFCCRWVCMQICIRLCLVLAFFKAWLAKLVIPERGLFYRPFENDALSSNSSKTPRVISQS